MGNGGYSSIIMIILMLVIFYLFLILPENKKKKKLNEMRSSLKVGDDIVTIGGMMGILTIIYRTAFIEIGKFQITRFQNIRSGYF